MNKLIITAALGVVALIGALLPMGENQTTVVEKLGAGAGHGTDTYLEVGGVDFYQEQLPFKQSTTTPVSYKTPGATSTLAYASCTGTLASTSATVITMAKAASPTATTTVIHAQAVAASAQFTATIPTATTSVSVFAPNTYFVVGIQGGVGGGFSPVGKGCVVRFVEA